MSCSEGIPMRNQPRHSRKISTYLNTYKFGNSSLSRLSRNRNGISQRYDSVIKKKQKTTCPHTQRELQSHWSIHLPLRSLGPIAQNVLPQLARAGLGQLLQDFDFARDHEPADVALVFGPLDDFLARKGSLLAGFERYEGFRSFAPLLIGDRHTCGFQDVWVRDQHGLECERRDVLTARDDDVLGAVKNLDRAIRVPDCQVARVQHAVSEELAGRCVVLVVSLRADVAEEDDFPDLLSVLGHFDHTVRLPFPSFVLFGLDHASLERGDEPVALAGHFGVFLFVGQVVPLRHLVSLGNGTVGFGQTVNVHGLQVEFLHSLEQVCCWWTGRDGDTTGFCDLN